MINKLFVAGLAYAVNDAQLTELFAQYGNVTSAKVITDKYSGQSKGFGFVEMSTADEAKVAMDKLNNTELLDRTIIVKEARPQEERKDGFQNRNDRYPRKDEKSPTRW